MTMQNKEIKPNTARWYDIHSHFLPGIDDGCANIDESIEVLRAAWKSGIVGMVATPHYYPNEPIQEFLAKRNAASDMLKRAVQEKEISVPSWVLGAEVAYYEGLIHSQELQALCIGKSRYLLLELPFRQWGQTVIKDVNAMSNMYNITPILAHLERYFHIETEQMMQEIYKANVKIQMNAEYVLKKETARNAKKLIRTGYVQALGSDAHHLHVRKPNLMEAVRQLDNKKLEHQAEEIRLFNQHVFESAK